MRIGGLGFSSFPSFGNMRIAAAREAVAPVRPAADDGADLLALTGLLRDLRAALTQGAETAGAMRGGRRSAAVRLGSADPLGLGMTSTAAALRSSAEVNALSTSYTPFGPSWSGSSTTLATLNGVYDGDQGDERLSFRVTRSGIVGSSAVRVDVFNEQGTRVDRLNFSNTYTPGTPVTLANGLTLSLGSGAAINNDTFNVTVSTSVGSAVDPSKPFNGTRNQRPNFEPGKTVGAGSFTLNGVLINVLANDTIASVLARIEASAAGVTAAFDAQAERVVLTQRTPGAGNGIVLSNDTSGFLSATKLDNAALEAGTDTDLERPISSVAALSGISSGTLQINGHAVAIDIMSDSLAAVLARIEASPAGVTARFDAQQGRVLLAGAGTLELDDGGTGFFAQLGLETGVHVGRSSRARGFQDPAGVRRGLEALAQAWNALFTAELGGATGRQATQLRGGLIAAARTAFAEQLGRGEGSQLRSRLGLDFALTDKASGALELDASTLARALREEPGALSALLLGDDDRHGGLLAALERAIDASVPALGRLLESRGLSFIDLQA